jgi:hypothetical protein
MAKTKNATETTDFAKVYEDWLQAKTDVRDAEERVALLKRLLLSIPEGKARAGVFHKQIPMTSVSYAQAWKALNANVLKGQQKAAAEAILAENTKTSFRSDFVLESEVGA